LREVGQVEADMLIAIGPHYIGDMVVSAWPDDRACTGIVSMEEQNPSDITSCLSSMHT
jgi:hypothetical protein